MHLTGEFAFEAPPEEVWQVLMDPDVLRSMLPGTERLEKLESRPIADSNHYRKSNSIEGTFTACSE